MDIVYLFKSVSNIYEDSLELRYSLRSIEKNLEHNKVFLIGDKPEWIQNIIYIPFQETTKYKGYNTTCKIYHLPNIQELSEDFVLFCDDIYCLKPVKQIVTYKGKDTLKNLLNFRKKHNKHWRALNRVLEIFPDALNYDVHHPYLLNKTLLNILSKKYPVDINKIYALSSLYNNEFKIEGTLVRDNKVKTIESFNQVLKNNPEFFSTNNIFVKNKEVQETMQKLFPNKSKYEI